ncbi:MAG TPA: response regulator transcription factor [Gemmatimonadaceae bacterium]|nr:response regulator transcription factor [Gemmatimonadaceae bacterium]
MMQPGIRILIADDHAVVREGIQSVLQAGEGFTVVATAATGIEALRLAKQHRPDVVVLDISMPGKTGLEVAAELRQALPDTRVLMLSIHDHAEYVLESVKAGAGGYLRKDAAPSELRDAVRAVHRGDSFFSAPVARHLGDGVRAAAEHDARRHRLASLSAREREVLQGIVSGDTNKEIAARLGISPRTVETHRESLMRKLEIRTVAGLTRFAVEMGLEAG